MFALCVCYSKPWPEKDNVGALTAVVTGQRMAPPPSAPEPVRRLMLECWAHRSSERPKTSRVRDMLGELVDELSSESSS